MKRPLHSIALALGLAAIGFSLGALAAGEFLVQAGDGMAAAATVAMLSFGGLAVGVVVSVILSKRLAGNSLPGVATIALLAGATTFGFAIWRGQQKRDAERLSALPPVPQVDAQGNPVPPPLPAAGAIDSLIGLVTAPPESLPRFETKGIDYETLGIAVYRAEGNWYLAGLKGGGRTWLNTRATGRFLQLGDLVVNRLNYLTPSWDSRIRDLPDVGGASRELTVKRDAGEAPSNVLETSGAGATLSFKVEIYERSPCETTGPPKVTATGWVSAWAKDGQPNVWFYSRGC